MSAASRGCRTRSRRRSCDVGETFRASACSSVVAGWSVSPRAATVPLAPTIRRPAKASAKRQNSCGRPRQRSAEPPFAQYAVSPRAASRKKVFTRWAARYMARAIESFSATRRNSTRPAPTAASLNMKNIDAPAPNRAGSPAGRERKTAISKPTTASSASPLVARCEYSIKVCADGERGMTSPLQSGQWLPQPAPDPLART